MSRNIPVRNAPGSELACLEDQITLTVSDNGHGFDMKSAPVNSLGLGIMRERAKGISAEISLTSEIDKGTEVRVLWRSKR